MARRDREYVDRAMVPAGSRMVLLVSRGPAPGGGRRGRAAVPDVVGRTQSDALRRLQDVGLDVRVVNDRSETVPRGRVSGQLPAPGGAVADGASAVLLVSSGRPEGDMVVPLPDVVGMPENEALEELQRSRIAPHVVQDYSATVPPGIVIAQLPDAAMVIDQRRRGIPPWVWLVAGLLLLALAALLFLLFGRETTVPDVTGVSLEQAEERLDRAGLDKGSVTTTESPTAEAGTVVAQDPTAGSAVRRGTDVNLVVVGEVGADAEPVEVPDVVGRDVEDAETVLEDAGFVVEVSLAPSDSVPEKEVIQQTPSAGQSVPPGTTVGLIASSGPAVRDVQVPDVTGLIRRDAESTLREAGLQVVVVRNPSEDVAADVVISQLPAGGDTVAQGTAVGIEVSSGPPAEAPTIVVPDVTGQTVEDAESALSDLGLRSQAVPVDSTDDPENEVIGQTPEPGEQLPPDSTVVIFYSTGP